jgi:cytochrome P450
MRFGEPLTLKLEYYQVNPARSPTKRLLPSTEWKTFKTVDLFIMISHRVVSRLLAGEELCRDENFIQTSLKFGDSVFVTGLIISQLPFGPFRGIAGWVLAQYHRLLLRRVMRMVEPVVQKRMIEAREKGTVPRYDDSIEWAIKIDEAHERDSRTISLEMLHILEAAAGAPGAMISEMMYQLLVEPHYIQPLRKEIQQAKAGNPSLNEMLQKLPLMDSFIMEINRMFPVGGGMKYAHDSFALADQKQSRQLVR